MSDYLDRAADDTQARAAEVIEQSTPADVPGYRMRYAEDAARALDAAGLLVSPERDAEIRADERGRCSIVHATLTDEALVAELVRRGVLREVEAECDDEVETGHCHDRMHWSYCDMSQTRVEVRRGLYERRDLAMGEDE